MRNYRFLPMAFVMFLFLVAGSFAQDAAEQSTTKFEKPILISSAGQSADVKLVGMLAKKQKLDAKVVVMAKIEDLKEVKTLIIVPGFSSKGLGAAGVSQSDEMDRVATLLKEASKLNIPVVLVHIGGNARRKGNSDAFNKLVAESSKHMIVVAQGDEDKFFTNLSNEKNIPLDLVPKIVKAAQPLGNLFK